MIQTKYPYIHFEKSKNHPHLKTEIWYCLNNKSNSILGTIKWYGTWKQYCFLPDLAIFNKGCLLDIIDFLNQLNKK